LSFVLHERSTSEAVRSTARRAIANAARLQNPSVSRLSIATRSIPDNLEVVTTWLTPSIGVPAQFADAIAALTGVAPDVMVVDRPGSVAVSFFRAPALLRLPGENAHRVGVGALVVRPSGRSAHLRVMGCYQWPQDQAAVVRALESLVQAYADQWIPDRAVWEGSAEQLLDGEVE
jgi:hypothetical protein